MRNPTIADLLTVNRVAVKVLQDHLAGTRNPYESLNEKQQEAKLRTIKARTGIRRIQGTVTVANTPESRLLLTVLCTAMLDLSSGNNAKEYQASQFFKRREDLEWFTNLLGLDPDYVLDTINLFCPFWYDIQPSRKPAGTSKV